MRSIPAFGAYGSMDPDINSTRVQQWNVTLERQLGTAWQASASYLGSYADRLWGQVHINPGTFMGLGPCTIAGVSYPSCTVTGNVDRRRTLFLENPVAGRWLGPIVKYADVGEQSYRGLKLSFRRRSDSGVSLSGNYTHLALRGRHRSERQLQPVCEWLPGSRTIRRSTAVIARRTGVRLAT